LKWKKEKKKVLELLREYQENIFFIRGTESDSKDDKEKLLEAISELRRTNQEVKRHYLCFDPMAEEYKGVRDYITTASQDIFRQLTQLKNLSHDIDQLESELVEKKK